MNKGNMLTNKFCRSLSLEMSDVLERVCWAMYS
jgi:hypothetical protein